MHPNKEDRGRVYKRGVTIGSHKEAFSYGLVACMLLHGTKHKMELATFRACESFDL